MACTYTPKLINEREREILGRYGLAMGQPKQNYLLRRQGPRLHASVPALQDRYVLEELTSIWACNGAPKQNYLLWKQGPLLHPLVLAV